MENKKGVSKWVWMSIVVAVLLGVGAYFLLAGSGAGGIPTPPALPA